VKLTGCRGWIVQRAVGIAAPSARGASNASNASNASKQKNQWGDG
jgi:hypothetical protein